MFKDRLSQEFSKIVQEVILYGSKARGDFNDDSDVDILVIASNADWKTYDKIKEVGYELDHLCVFSFQVLPVSHMKDIASINTQFYRNIIFEGISL
ncbi:nucleotidyltransferase domain-containing protein [Deltaproteobacteria bacterium TL4]